MLKGELSKRPQWWGPRLGLCVDVGQKPGSSPLQALLMPDVGQDESVEETSQPVEHGQAQRRECKLCH